MNYKQLVSKGKSLLEKIGELQDRIKSHQAEVAKLAVQACDIQRGGSYKGSYTLAHYADDIGLNPATLRNWVSIYQNVLVKLDIKRPTPREWSRASSANAVMRQENKGVSKRHLKKEYVEKAYEGEVDNPVVRDFYRITQLANSTIKILHKRDLSLVPDARLLKTMELLDEASEIINEYLTRKRGKR